MRSSALTNLNSLLKKPSFSAQDAKAKGVPPALLSYYSHKGYIEKLSRGVYRGLKKDRKAVPFEWEDLIATARSIPNGVICLISALSIYDLTLEVPRQFWIAVPNENFAPRRPQTKIIRMRDTNTGMTQLTLGQVKVRIFDRERTIVDAFRYLSKEIAIKALRSYLQGQHQKPNLKKLMTYSKTLRAPIAAYLEALTT